MKTYLPLLFTLATFVCPTHAKTENAGEPLSAKTALLVKSYEKRKLNDKDRETLSLLKFGMNSLSMTNMELHWDDNSKDLNKEDLSRCLTQAIFALDWGKPLSPSEKAFIKQKRDYFKSAFGEQSYAWIWMQNQLGEKAEVQGRLLRLFEQEYQRVLGSHYQWFDKSPLRAAEVLREALLKSGAASEKTTLDEKVRKMKIHLSKQQDAGVVT